MKNFKRVIIIVLDSLGVGALPDAGRYGDSGANTLVHILDAMPEINIPYLCQLGLCNIDGVKSSPSGEQFSVKNPSASFARMAEASVGKDTITGHWEIAGLVTDVPFQTFEKFPDDFISEFEDRIGSEVLGNYPASGTEIIDLLGPEHERSGKPIVYTSSDSVFQIVANTSVIPLARLYEICEIAREMLVGPLLIGRVIARPYELHNGKRTRTSERRDYAVPPPAATLLDNIKNSGGDVVAIGKIYDIFSGRGITESIHIENNADGCKQTIEKIRTEVNAPTLIFTNLVDFDSQYGHRRDALGYGHAIEEFDNFVPEILDGLKSDDLLIITADHGTDPTFTGFDHTREYTPLLVFGNQISCGENLGTRNTFADIGSTVTKVLGARPTKFGSSFL
jgi:phosphopentomutase